MIPRASRLAALAALALALSACGPSPPNYDDLAQAAVTTNCGGSYDAATLVRQAYDGAPFAALPAPVSIPEGTVAAGARIGTDAPLRRFFPCADDGAAAVSKLSDLGFTDLSYDTENPRLLFVNGKDPFGIDGYFAVYKCEFVGDLEQQLSGNFMDMGVRGSFTGVSALPEVETAREFANISLHTGLVNVATTGYVENLVVLGLEDQFTTRTFSETDYATLDVCAVWVEPNLWGGCDLVTVGDAFLIANEDGTFHMLPFVGSPIYSYAGYCGRSE